MAKVGDKYIIEIGRANVDSDGTPYYSVKGAEWYGLSEMLLSKLERFDPDADYDAGYRGGMVETWEAAKKLALIEELGGMTPSEIMEAFGKGGGRVFAEMDPADVIETLNQYERKKEQDKSEIHVGDEVKSADGTWIVTTMKRDFCIGFDSDGNIYGNCKNDLTKTGRSFLGFIVALEERKEADAPLRNN